MKFLTAINLNQNELQNAKVQNLGTDPSGLVSGNAGQIWYNTTDNHAKVWNGSAADYLTNVLETISVDSTLSATPSGKNVALAVQVYLAGARFAIEYRPLLEVLAV